MFKKESCSGGRASMSTTDTKQCSRSKAHQLLRWQQQHYWIQCPDMSRYGRSERRRIRAQSSAHVLQVPRLPRWGTFRESMPISMDTTTTQSKFPTTWLFASEESVVLLEHEPILSSLGRIVLGTESGRSVIETAILETYQLGNVSMTIGTSQSMLSLSVDDVKVVGKNGQEEMDILRMDIDMRGSNAFIDSSIDGLQSTEKQELVMKLFKRTPMLFRRITTGEVTTTSEHSSLRVDHSVE